MSGKSVDEISEIRGLKKQTIESHIVDLYERENLELAKILPLSNIEKLKIIKTCVEKNFPNGVERLRELKDQLPKKISYFDIHLSIAMMKKRDL